MSWIDLQRTAITTPQLVQDFMGNMSWWNGTYRLIDIHYFELYTDTDAKDLECLLSMDEVFKAGAADYAWTFTSEYAGAGSSGAGPSDSKINMFPPGISDNADNAISGRIRIFNPGSSISRQMLRHNFVGRNSFDHKGGGGRGSGEYLGDASQEMNGLRLRMSDGAKIAAARFIVVGLPNQEPE